MSFLSDRGWGKIWDKAKHFMVSAFLVVLLYGIPKQYFNLNVSNGWQLFFAAIVAWGIGFWWEFRKGGNKSHGDIWADFAGVVTGMLFCLGAI